MNTKVQVTGHEWSEETLFCKAVLYFEQMESHTANEWQYGFWSALGLELLARAALAHISPVFLANTNNWRNLAHALGKESTAKKFSPSSIGITSVFGCLRELTSDFSKETSDFCKQHMERRNSEIHSGHLAFASLDTSKWLPEFYLACKVLTESMERDLADLIPNPTEATSLINSFKVRAAEAVEESIKAHKIVWSNKTKEEKAKASSQAVAWARKSSGHRTKCPACDAPALLKGSPSGPVSTRIEGDDIVQKQAQLPSSFECIACGLRISGLSKLSACGLGKSFSETSTYTAAEFFELYTEDDLDEAARGFEGDFNE